MRQRFGEREIVMECQGTKERRRIGKELVVVSALHLAYVSGVKHLSSVFNAYYTHTDT